MPGSAGEVTKPDAPGHVASDRFGDGVPTRPEELLDELDFVRSLVQIAAGEDVPLLAWN